LGSLALRSQAVKEGLCAERLEQCRLRDVL
jgi:hypothetical protein